MKKDTRNKLHSTDKSKIALAATMLVIPVFSIPATGLAAETVHLYLKCTSNDLKDVTKFQPVGSKDGRTIYKNTKGESFYCDANGDMKFLTSGQIPGGGASNPASIQNSTAPIKK